MLLSLARPGSVIPLLLVVAFVLGGRVVRDACGQDKHLQETRLIRGKSVDAWIAQIKDGKTIQDRHNALQVLRNGGLSKNRKKTLRAFTEALSDELPSIRSLAAAGLLKAGLPTDPCAPAKLAEIISQDLTDAKPIEFQPGQASRPMAEVNFPSREIRALGVIGEKKHIPALKQITENQAVHSILRQFADRSIGQIERRANKVESRSAKERAQPANDRGIKQLE